MINEKRSDAKWLVAFACIGANFLSKPLEFLSNPQKRVSPTWACGVIQAADEAEAYHIGSLAWDTGLLNGPLPGPDVWPMNWYVAPLGDVPIDHEVISADQLRRNPVYQMHERWREQESDNAKQIPR